MSVVKNLQTVALVPYGNIVIGQMRIVKGADVQYEFEETIPNTEQPNYLIHTKGTMAFYKPNGERMGTRTAGETTNTSIEEYPAGICTIKADTDVYEYLCVTKRDDAYVVREEHRLIDGQELTITNDTKVLVLISGSVRLNGVDFYGPEVIEIKSSSVRLVSAGDSFISKVS